MNGNRREGIIDLLLLLREPEIHIFFYDKVCSFRITLTKEDTRTVAGQEEIQQKGETPEHHQDNR